MYLGNQMPPTASNYTNGPVEDDGYQPQMDFRHSEQPTLTTTTPQFQPPQAPPPFWVAQSSTEQLPTTTATPQFQSAQAPPPFGVAQPPTEPQQHFETVLDVWERGEDVDLSEYVHSEDEEEAMKRSWTDINVTPLPAYIRTAPLPIASDDGNQMLLSTSSVCHFGSHVSPQTPYPRMLHVAANGACELQSSTAFPHAFPDSPVNATSPASDSQSHSAHDSSSQSDRNTDPAYRRRRLKNNAASKKSRDKRTAESKNKKHELGELEKTNLQLKTKIDELTEQVAFFRSLVDESRINAAP